jgi:hypothetical protein
MVRIFLADLFLESQVIVIISHQSLDQSVYEVEKK